MAKAKSKPTKKSASKKPTIKKAAASSKKKPAAKKITRPKKPAVSKKPQRKKAQTTQTSAKSGAKRTTTAGRPVIARFPASFTPGSTRRPPNNPEVPPQFIESMDTKFAVIKEELESYSAHLRPLDRKRLNGVDIRTLGFIERAFELAAENPEFLPHWLTIEKFEDDNNYFLALRSIYDTTRQLQEMLWNIIIGAADTLYTDALEYYHQVSDAARRRIDPAETLHADLFTFFESRGKRKSKEPTDQQLKRDFDALLKGRADGRLLLENKMPKIQAGKRKVIDETYKDSAKFKDSAEGEIEE